MQVQYKPIKNLIKGRPKRFAEHKHSRVLILHELLGKIVESLKVGGSSDGDVVIVIVARGLRNKNLSIRRQPRIEIQEEVDDAPSH